MVGYKPFLWPGITALIITPGLSVIAVGYLLFSFLGTNNSLLVDTYTIRVIQFTFLQALLSTGLSVIFALPISRALARQTHFHGRDWIITIFGLPLLIPVLVSVFGVISIWGHNGFLSWMLQTFGLQPLEPIFGLHGILITHVFFNMPLIVRLLLPSWDLIPGETWRIASMTGMSSWSIFKTIELPRIKEALPGIAILVFLLCFTSFTTVLVMGGGPQATTLEVAIYHEVRSNFNIPKAVLLSILQVGICLLVSLILLKFSILPEDAVTEKRNLYRPDGNILISRCGDGFWIGIGCLWITGPLSAIILKGLQGPVGIVLISPEVWLAVLRSVMVGVGSGLLAMVLGILLCMTTRDLAVRSQRVNTANQMELLGSQTLIVSPVVLGTGLFVILSPWVPVFSYSLVLATIINGLIAVPFAVRFISPVFRQTLIYHDKLCASLGVTGLNRVLILEIPNSKTVIFSAFALITSMATGDLTSVIFFSTGQDQTLAVLLYQALGNYRADESAVMALLLIVVCLAIYIIIQGIGRVLFRSNTQ